jgi:hypothetical protein
LLLAFVVARLWRFGVVFVRLRGGIGWRTRPFELGGRRRWVRVVMLATFFGNRTWIRVEHFVLDLDAGWPVADVPALRRQAV